MVKMKYIVRYFVKNYPHKSELSKTRITKMVYLADWYNALQYGEQLTKIDWYFDHYGPYVVDVFNAVKEDRNLKVVNGYTRYGSPKQTIELNDNNISIFHHRLNGKVIKILDKVIDKTKSMYWDDFIEYIYSSYPIKQSKRFKVLDLEQLAIKCKEQGLDY